MLNRVADASILAIEDLKRKIDAADLDRAVRMMQRANVIHIVGYGPASWIAAYLSYGLNQLECRCRRIDSQPGMALKKISSLGSNDLLLAVCLSDDDDSAARIAAAARMRGIRAIAFAHSISHPLAAASDLFMAMPVSRDSRFQPWAARLAFAQVVLLALEKRQAGHTAC